MRNQIVDSLDRAGWRIPEWCRATGVCRSKAFELLKSGELRSVAVGRARVILTAPRDYLETLAAGR